jgi:hypothetical protein
MLENRPNFFLSDPYHTIFYNVRSHKNATTVLKQNSVYIPRIHSWISVCMLAINASIYLWLLSERVSHWIHTGNVTSCVMCVSHTHTHICRCQPPSPLKHTDSHLQTFNRHTDKSTPQVFSLTKQKTTICTCNYLNFSWFITCHDRFCTIPQLSQIDARIVLFYEPINDEN